MDQTDADARAKGREKPSLKLRGVVEHNCFRNDPPRAHRGDEGADGGTDIRVQEEITENIAA